jgi:hypothetical protein
MYQVAHVARRGAGRVAWAEHTQVRRVNQQGASGRHGGVGVVEKRLQGV